MDSSKDIVKLQHNKLNINDIVDLVSSPKSGAISTFIGTTRDNFENKQVLKLQYEAYESMALKEMKNICGKIRSENEVDRIAIFHRLGEVPVLEASVVIAISSSHRRESLEAVQQAIDLLKASVPIWKKEIYKDNNCAWKENKECSWSHCKTVEMKYRRVKTEVNSDDDDNNVEEFSIDPSMVQIKADSSELNRRIEAFILRKREQSNLLNIQEFCTRGNVVDENENSCARVDAVLIRHKDSKSHVKVHRVLNPWGPQTVDPSVIQSKIKTEHSSSYHPALEERLSNTEKFLGINKPVPRDIYERLKKIEDQITFLETISPEYKDCWIAVQKEGPEDVFKSGRKRKFSTAELDMKLIELEDKYVKKLN